MKHEQFHDKSLVSQCRRNFPYLAINCATIPENLLEGMLFGTSVGAVTGAIDKAGLLEKAAGGTLHLDEVNSMPLNLQAKLLRFLQERKVRRIGSMKEFDVDLKIISSINVPATKPLRRVPFDRICFTVWPSCLSRSPPWQSAHPTSTRSSLG